jgi:hypothetical protein
MIVTARQQFPHCSFAVWTVETLGVQDLTAAVVFLTTFRNISKTLWNSDPGQKSSEVHGDTDPIGEDLTVSLT